MNHFHTGAAQFSPSQLHLVGLPSTFPAQTTVVICGVYPTVQRSPGRIVLLHFLAGLLEVPVFAATVLQLIVRAFLQKLESGRALLSERIFETI
jgi:hypothetical protein